MPSNAKSRQPQTAHTAAHPAQPATIKLKPYVTVGSTRDEVLAQQGTPTASSEDKLVYGTSELYLKDGRVVGWRIDPFSSPIRVKLWPQSPVDSDLEFFTVNSTKDEVLVVQGTPTEFSEDTFKYGDSVVFFSRNRVVNWKNDPGSVPLRAR
jgi:outer membrane protein assembly factor BamE (lipoprotein component of BamABCDE complex)